MTRAKRILCLILAMATIMTICAVGFTAQAAVVDTAETAVAYPTSADDFTWDNATMYFLLTDRFYNGNKSNDNSYNRGKDRNGNVTSINNVAAFQGGDFKGITQKIEAGYFDDLGINAIWVAGWFEQVHGYIVGGDGKKSFPHYSYHGYYASDFTELDKNFGTEAEFKEMIDTAHEHGIRIVLDVVMNHPGYNSVYDMNEYGFGVLKNGWQDVYYNYGNINQTNYHGVIDYNNNPTAWGKWWGTNWIRAGLAGYQNNGAGDLTGSVTFLPDFKTESTSTVDIPELLKTKWNKEGTYNAKVNEINATFSKYNLGNKTVTNYLVAWYAKWVEEFGIDGFRCDTAKHVDMSSWKKLSEACTKALQNWRKDNPNAVGSDWDEDFWMTGENFGQGLANNNYYQNGFDSMINFSFSGDSAGNGCNGMKKAGNLNETYANYANQINSNPNFNALTYISSHDTGLCRDDLYYQGSALLLLPGGVQIFYGDETNRPYVDCSIHDHEMRGFMNWSSFANASSNEGQILAHWQKVGTFRNNHIAVGAGSHKGLSATSGTAFARIYDKNGVKDTVVCVVGANNNSNVTITLNGAFADGTQVKNAYTGDTATVSGGKVSFNAGAHGTILVEVAGGTTPTTPTTPSSSETTPSSSETTPSSSETTPSTPIVTEYVILGDADLSDKVNVKDATLVQKFVASLSEMSEKERFAGNVDGSAALNVKDATAIQKFVAGIETGYDIGEKVVYKQGTAEDTTPSVPDSQPTVPTQTDATEPSTEQPEGTVDLTKLDGQVIVLMNSSYATPYAHTWTDQGGAYDSWPGTAMQQVGDYYFIIVNQAANMIIFNDNGGAQTEDLSIPGNFAIYDGSANSWSGYLSDFVDVTKFPMDPSLLPSNPVDPTPTPSSENTDPVEGSYVYLRDAAGWGCGYAHCWSGSSGTDWPGYMMENVGGNLYRVAVSNDYSGAQYQNVVFNNGGNGAQTGDLTIQVGMAYNNQTNSWEAVN